MSTPPAEPSDHHVYNWVSFNKDTFEFFLAAVHFYAALVKADIDAVREDQDLRALLTDEAIESYPIAKELQRVARVQEFFEKKIEEGGKNAHSYDASIAHGLVRFVKSVAMLYLEHLRVRRQAVAARPATSKAMLAAIDQQLARF